MMKVAWLSLTETGEICYSDLDKERRQSAIMNELTARPIGYEVTAG
jgi:hypothetical protein